MVVQDLLDAIHKMSAEEAVSPLDRILDLFNNRGVQSLKSVPVIRLPLKISSFDRASVIASNIKLIKFKQLIESY